MSIIELDNDTIYQSVFKNNKPVILEFYADWCKPCLELLGLLDSLKDSYKDTLDIFKINYDKNKEIAEEFEITTLPTTILFKEGNEIGRYTGTQSKQQLKLLISII